MDIIKLHGLLVSSGQVQVYHRVVVMGFPRVVAEKILMLKHFLCDYLCGICCYPHSRKLYSRDPRRRRSNVTGQGYVNTERERTFGHCCTLPQLQSVQGYIGYWKGGPRALECWPPVQCLLLCIAHTADYTVSWVNLSPFFTFTPRQRVEV